MVLKNDTSIYASHEIPTRCQKFRKVKNVSPHPLIYYQMWHFTKYLINEVQDILELHMECYTIMTFI